MNPLPPLQELASVVHRDIFCVVLEAAAELAYCIGMFHRGRAELRASVTSPMVFIFLTQNHRKSRKSCAKSTATITKLTRATHERETTHRLPDSTNVFTDQRRYPRAARERLRIHEKERGQHTSVKTSSKTFAVFQYYAKPQCTTNFIAFYGAHAQ